MSERYFPDGMPPPLADPTTLPWWEAAADHRLVVQRCADCQATRLPPAPVCAACRSTEFDWTEVPGAGSVYTFTIVHRPIAADQQLPFVIAVVALENSGGLRMISNLVEVDPDDVEIGMALEVVWEDMSEDLAIPRFRPQRA
ncbi:MAG TPA: Zn-ribbon domain-containing OB-fold protein [Myxococcales bacterium]|nr:Zn-ribbon domain-containing OB-fold protein [Myxococcales bacterium]